MNYDSVPVIEPFGRCRPDFSMHVLHPIDITWFDTMTTPLPTCLWLSLIMFSVNTSAASQLWFPCLLLFELVLCAHTIWSMWHTGHGLINHMNVNVYLQTEICHSCNQSQACYMLTMFISGQEVISESCLRALIC